MKKTIFIIAVCLSLLLTTNINTNAQFGNQVVPTNSASFVQGLSVGLSSLFPNSIKPLTKTVAIAASTNETNLGGTEVFVNGTAAPLLFVSPSQINFYLHPNYGGKTVNLRVKSSDGSEQYATYYVGFNPGLFTANGRGNGYLAATQTIDGVTYLPVAKYSADTNSFDAVPVQAFVGGKQNYLILNGTGLGYASKVVFTKGNQSTTVDVDYCGAHSILLGMDQANVKVPNIASGTYAVTLVAAGISTNAGLITIQ